METIPTKKPSLLKSKALRYSLFGLVAFLCICCVIAAALSPDDQTAAPAPQATSSQSDAPNNTPIVLPTDTQIPLPTNTPAPTAILDPKAALRSEIEKVLGEGNRDIPKVTAINFDDPEPGEIHITWALDDNLTMEMVGGRARTEATNIIHAISQSKIDYIDVQLVGTFTLVDEFGNEREADVFILNFNKSTVDQINWDNFLEDNIDNIADSYFIRPEIQD